MVSEEFVFQMILHGGNARSSAMEAISFAKQKKITNAQSKLEEANNELNTAHQQQTELLQREADEDNVNTSLLLTHALDHLMNAETVKEMATEFVDLYEHLKIHSGVKENEWN